MDVHRPFPASPRDAALYSLNRKRVWVAGHRGLVGSALVRRLVRENCEIITASKEELDLRCQAATRRWLRVMRPEVVVIAAATVGGIHANRSRPAEFVYDNLSIAVNIIDAAHSIGAEKLLYLGSSCIYPRLCSQPMREDQLLAGSLEPTNQWYAIAKLAGLFMAKAYKIQYGMDSITALPTNVYGPGDNFDIEQSHVISGLLVKLHNAKINGDRAMEVWGTGKPKREFLYVDDLADALVFLLTHYRDEEPVNVGSGEEISIADLAQTAASVVGFHGELVYDASMPDGAPRKLLDTTRMTLLGWKPHTPLLEGLKHAYAWYLDHLC